MFKHVLLFKFIDPDAGSETPVHPIEPEKPPAELPLVPRG